MKRDPYDDAHLFASYVPAHMFAEILAPKTPQPLRPDSELIPGRDDLEKSE